MRKILGLILTAVVLLYSCYAFAMITQESATVKGEVIEVYDPPVPDDSVVIEELRKNCKAEIKIIDIISEREGDKAYSMRNDAEKGNVIPVHELISKEPLVKNQVFIGELTYLLIEHHKYGCVTNEVTLEIKEILSDKTK